MTNLRLFRGARTSRLVDFNGTFRWFVRSLRA